jgi:hypothetical protein
VSFSAVNADPCKQATAFRPSGGLLSLTGLSDNVGGVKHFLSTLLHALGEERHFALVEGVAFPTVGSLVIHSGQDTRSDPCISSVTTLIMITTSNSSRERGAGCPINSSMFYSTPRPVPSWPACEPNFFTCW